jgi:predicted PurR-regulated permease PerM
MTTPRAPRLSAAIIAEFRSVATTGLFLLAVFYTLHLGQDFFLPIVLALVLSLLLRPLVRGLQRLRIPASMGALLLVVTLVGGAGFAAYQLWEPAADWVARAPQDLKRLDTRVRRLLRSVEQVSQTAAQVDQIAAGGSDTPQVEIKRPSLSQVVLGSAWHVLARGLIVLVLLYFFLASGDQFLKKLPRILPPDQADEVLASVAETERQISTYLLSVSLINLGLGALTALVMGLLGMPTPVLLGAVAAVLNFVPYLGPAVMATLLAMVALLSFPDAGQAIPAPLAYLGLHTVEANFVTPHLLGRRLPLNPTAIFVGFLFWWWIWGVVGALLAVPLMVVIKVVCDRTEELAGVGELLDR